MVGLGLLDAMTVEPKGAPGGIVAEFRVLCPGPSPRGVPDFVGAFCDRVIFGTAHGTPSHAATDADVGVVGTRIWTSGLAATARPAPAASTLTAPPLLPANAPVTAVPRRAERLQNSAPAVLVAVLMATLTLITPPGTVT